MDFNANKPNPAKNLPRLAIVAVLHVLVFSFIIESMGIRTMAPPPPATTIVSVDTPAPPPEPRKETPMKMDAPKVPDFYRPPVEQVVLATPAKETISGGNPDAAAVRPAVGSGAVGMAEPPVKIAVHVPVRVAAVADSSACQRPEYPRNALRTETTGTVALAFLIGVDGRVLDSRVDRSSGSRELDRAAQAGLALCRFKPGTVDGVAEQSWARLEYVWKIE